MTALLVAKVDASAARSIRSLEEYHQIRWMTRSSLAMELRTDSWHVGGSVVYKDFDHTVDSTEPKSVFCNHRVRGLLSLALKRLSASAIADAAVSSTARRRTITK